jgi:hypothetical protein
VTGAAAAAELLDPDAAEELLDPVAADELLELLEEQPAIARAPPTTRAVPARMLRICFHSQSVY